MKMHRGLAYRFSFDDYKFILNRMLQSTHIKSFNFTLHHSPSPGKISNKYEGMGGECTYFGKPHAEHFKACLRDLGLTADRVVHVGDSLHHDIAGANEAGISSIFITGGIHSDDFDCSIGEIPDKKTLQELFEKENSFPTHVAPLLKY